MNTRVRKPKKTSAFHHHRGVLADEQPAYRACLGGCDRMFLIPGPGRRICPRCEKRNATYNRAKNDR